MRRNGVCIAVVALAVLAGGCGTSETKRAVDPRTEVLRFFAPSVDVVALLRTDRLGQLPEIEAAMSGIPGYRPIGDLLERAGLDPSGIRDLVDSDDDSAEIGPPELAIGADNLVFAPPLLALDTGDESRLDQAVRRREESGSIRTAGELHDATIYLGDGFALATRDGVLLASTEEDTVRTALEIRDGDRDGQLDDGEVGDLLEELPEAAPIHAYADFTALISPDRALNELAGSTPWLAAMGRGGLSIASSGPGVELDAFAELDRDSLEEAELPAGEEFTAFSLSRGLLGGLLTTEGDSQLRAPLLAMAPIDGEASATTDELRVRVELVP
jgi:hypothetical protein